MWSDFVAMVMRKEGWERRSHTHTCTHAQTTLFPFQIANIVPTCIYILCVQFIHCTYIYCLHITAIVLLVSVWGCCVWMELAVVIATEIVHEINVYTEALFRCGVILLLW